MKHLKWLVAFAACTLLAWGQGTAISVGGGGSNPIQDPSPTATITLTYMTNSLRPYFIPIWEGASALNTYTFGGMVITNRINTLNGTLMDGDIKTNLNWFTRDLIGNWTNTGKFYVTDTLGTINFNSQTNTAVWGSATNFTIQYATIVNLSNTGTFYAEGITAYLGGLDITNRINTLTGVLMDSDINTNLNWFQRELLGNWTNKANMVTDGTNYAAYFSGNGSLLTGVGGGGDIWSMSNNLFTVLSTNMFNGPLYQTNSGGNMVITNVLGYYLSKGVFTEYSGKLVFQDVDWASGVPPGGILFGNNAAGTFEGAKAITQTHAIWKGHSGNVDLYIGGNIGTVINEHLAQVRLPINGQVYVGSSNLLNMSVIGSKTAWLPTAITNFSQNAYFLSNITVRGTTTLGNSGTSFSNLNTSFIYTNLPNMNAASYSRVGPIQITGAKPGDAVLATVGQGLGESIAGIGDTNFVFPEVELEVVHSFVSNDNNIYIDVSTDVGAGLDPTNHMYRATVIQW